MKLKPIAIAGVVLVVLGIIGIVFEGLAYMIRDTVLDIGPLQPTADRDRTLLLQPMVGVAAVAGGLVLLMSGMRKHA
ncbi:MAG TPA: hypothetical protein VEK56_11655 [Vicinamibacterales bacterium]|nr:hypothetical protein [Vicinamibacterales bacterium]